MTTIAENIAGVRQHIQAASNGREVKLLAVSKTFPVESIAEAVRAGQRCFGENYAQEGAAKVEFFKEHYPDIELEWHFIGPLQANKTRLVAEHFQWIESLSRLKIAQRLNEQRPAHMSAINALVEINIDDEEGKSGIAPEALSDFLASVSLLPNIQLRGLMCIPKADADETEKRQTFARMKKNFRRLPS